MNNEKLKEIGGRLDISEEDLKNIKIEKQKFNLIYPIIGVIVAICSTILGYLLGKNTEPKLVNAETGKTYPYSLFSFAILIATINLRKNSNRKVIIISIILTAIISIIGFVSAYNSAQPIEYYHGTIKYGVHNMCKVKINE